MLCSTTKDDQPSPRQCVIGKQHNSISVRLVWRPKIRPEWLKHSATPRVLLNVLDGQLIIGEVPLSSGWYFDSLPLKTSPTGNPESNFQVHLPNSNGTRRYETFESGSATGSKVASAPNWGNVPFSGTSLPLSREIKALISQTQSYYCTCKLSSW